MKLLNEAREVFNKTFDYIMNVDLIRNIVFFIALILLIILLASISATNDE